MTDRTEVITLRKGDVLNLNRGARLVILDDEVLATYLPKDPSDTLTVTTNTYVGICRVHTHMGIEFFHDLDGDLWWRLGWGGTWVMTAGYENLDVALEDARESSGVVGVSTENLQTRAFTNRNPA